jgi:hypothetical protein
LSKVKDLGEEIDLLRVMMRRVLEAVEKCPDPQVLMDALGALGLGASRVAALSQLQEKQGKKELDEALDKVIKEMNEEWFGVQ